MTTNNKLKLFDRTDLMFKTVNDHPLEVTVLTPKTLQSKPRAEYPVIVNWHGGGFVVGDRMYEEWLPPWLLDLSLSTPAILIAPAYRLLPEANAADIMGDLEDFWKWLHNDFPALTTTWVAIPDLSRLACTGQSSGCYMATQSILRFPQLAQIKFLVTMGGTLNTNISRYRIPGPKSFLGKQAPPPPQAEKIVRTYVKNMKPGAVRTSGDAVEMWDFLTCVLQQAYLPRWLGIKGKDELDIMKSLEKAREFPPVWVVQGTDDSVVPPICSTGFVDKLKEVLPNVPVLLTLQPGDHGFEVNHSVEDVWVRQGLEFVKKYWLGVPNIEGVDREASVSAKL